MDFGFISNSDDDDDDDSAFVVKRCSFKQVLSLFDSLTLLSCCFCCISVKHAFTLLSKQFIAFVFILFKEIKIKLKIKTNIEKN